MLVRAVVLTEFRCPPLPIVGQQISGDSAIINSHDLMAIFMTQSFRLSDESKNSVRRQIQEVVRESGRDTYENFQNFNTRQRRCSGFMKSCPGTPVNTWGHISLAPHFQQMICAYFHMIMSPHSLQRRWSTRNRELYMSLFSNACAETYAQNDNIHEHSRVVNIYFDTVCHVS
jgi:hypothetical protein